MSSFSRLLQTLSLLGLYCVLLSGCKSDAYKSIEEVKIHHEDIALFWKMYDQFDRAQSKSLLVKQQYFLKGSPGLKSLVTKGNMQAGSFAEWISNHREFLNSIRPSAEATIKDTAKIRELLRAFQELIPKAQFKDIYFVIGQNKFGGTLTPNGFVIELQKNLGDTPGLDTSTIDRRFLANYEDIDRLIVHEQVHVSQRPTKLENDLLKIAINEGVATFIAYLVTGKEGNQQTFSFGYKNEETLKEEFIDDLEKDINHVRYKWAWNWNKHSDERPADLGYFIGFRIAQSYYEKQEDKQVALETMIDLENYDGLVKESGYF